MDKHIEMAAKLKELSTTDRLKFFNACKMTIEEQVSVLDKSSIVDKMRFDVYKKHNKMLDEPNGLAQRYYESRNMTLEYTADEIKQLSDDVYTDLPILSIIEDSRFDLSKIVLIAVAMRVNKDEKSKLLFDFLFSKKNAYFLTESGWTKDQVKRAKSLKTNLFNGNSLTKFTILFDAAKDLDVLVGLVTRESNLILNNNLNIRKQKINPAFTYVDSSAYTLTQNTAQNEDQAEADAETRQTNDWME